MFETGAARFATQFGDFTLRRPCHSYSKREAIGREAVSIRAGQLLPADFILERYALPLSVARRYCGAPAARVREIAAHRHLCFIASGRNNNFSDIYNRVLALLKTPSHGRCASDGVEQAIKRYVDAIREREQTFIKGLALGTFYALGKAKHAKGSTSWISGDAWELECTRYSAIHVVDLVGIDVFAAVKVFSCPRLSEAIVALEGLGAIYGDFYPDKDTACEFHRLFAEARQELSNRVASSELIASGVSPSDLAPDPWTGHRPDKKIVHSLFRLPDPLAVGESSKLRQGSKAGRPRRIDRSQLLIAGAEWLADKCKKNPGFDVKARGVVAELVDYLCEKALDEEGEDGVGRTTAHEIAKEVVALARRFRNDH